MKKNLLFLFFALLSINLFSQPIGGEWFCAYSTYDAEPNATGYNTISVGVVSEDMFAALVYRKSNNTNYLVGYAEADSMNGRLGDYSSVGAGFNTQWISGTDDIELFEAVDIAASYDSLVYVANNDAAGNILVFKLTDSVVTADYRLETGADSLWAIDVDGFGRVFVSSIKDAVTASEVLVFESITAEAAWGTTHTASPLTTITMPEPGEIRGVTVNPFGTVVFASNYTAKKIYRFDGDPSTGFTLTAGFNFTFLDSMRSANNTLLNPGPWGLAYMSDRDILFAAADVNFTTGAGYEYGKIFIIDGTSAAILDTINTAEWNFQVTGAYNSRAGGTVGTASGYTSTYNVELDDIGNLYTQSYYGWAADKWQNTEIIPVELTSFSANVNGKAVTLTWTTATEINNRGFEVERKNENNSWKNIGFINGKGTTAEKQVYSYIDEEITAGKYSYRLKQVDYDGSFEYSNVVEVDINVPGKFSLGQNYPNPFNPSTRIKYSIAQDGLVSLKLYDILGNEVAVLVNEVKEAGDYELEFNSSSVVSGLTSGIYFYTISSGNFTATKKLVLLK